MPVFPAQNRFGAMQAATQTMIDTGSDPVGRFLRDSASSARDMRAVAWQRCAAARLAMTTPPAVAPTPAPVNAARPENGSYRRDDLVEGALGAEPESAVTVFAR